MFGTNKLLKRVLAGMVQIGHNQILLFQEMRRMSAALDQLNTTLDAVAAKVDTITLPPAGVPEADVQAAADKAGVILADLNTKFPS